MKKGADVKAKAQFGKTVLFGASRYGNLEVVKYLIDHGADIDAKDKDGNTALKVAMQKKYTEIVKHLIKHGAKE